MHSVAAPIIDAEFLCERPGLTALGPCAHPTSAAAEPPNQIVFCERCDVAVHQNCYGIAVVPEGEWLCEPCKQYEEVMKAQGMPQVRVVVGHPWLLGWPWHDVL